MKKTNNTKIGKMGGLEWEMRPGGMLVQKRNLDTFYSPKKTSVIFPTIKIHVNYFGSSSSSSPSSTLPLHINSHATFGELKKMLTRETGVDPENQKLVFEDRERESKTFLDVCGVKDGSTIVVVVEDQDKKRGNFNIEKKALNSVAEVAMEVDKLVHQVAVVESVICKGGRVAEKELLTLIELFMSQLIKLDGIVANGDLKHKRKTQVIRIQKYMENVDGLKAENGRRMSNGRRLIVSQRRCNSITGPS